jgi:hypothetical protein
MRGLLGRGHLRGDAALRRRGSQSPGHGGGPEPRQPLTPPDDPQLARAAVATTADSAAPPRNTASWCSSALSSACSRFRVLAAARTSRALWRPRSPGSSPGSCGRDDRLTTVAAPAPPSRDRPRRCVIRTTRRDTAAAGPIPEQTMPWLAPGDRSQRHLPVYDRRAVPNREYHCGGQPIPADPACRATPGAARPPPDRARTAHASHHRLGCLQPLRRQRGGSHLS